MTYRGQVKGGVVVFEHSPPPDGSRVRVELEQSITTAPSDLPNQTLWDKLRKYSGALTGLPKDLARNHDHYIHGSPRR